MYAYFQRLDYFSTECVYAPFAARGFARDLVKDLEVRGSIGGSGLRWVWVCFGGEGLGLGLGLRVEGFGCRLGRGGVSMVDRFLSFRCPCCAGWRNEQQQPTYPPTHQLDARRHPTPPHPKACRPSAIIDLIHSAESWSVAHGSHQAHPQPRSCDRCGYICSQPVCKACLLLEGLNKGLPRLGISKVKGGGGRGSGGKRGGCGEGRQDGGCGSADCAGGGSGSGEVGAAAKPGAAGAVAVGEDGQQKEECCGGGGCGGAGAPQRQRRPPGVIAYEDE